MLTNFFNSLILLTSLITAGSVFVHDTRIDRAAMAATSLPLPTYDESNASKLLSGDAHTHVERVSVGQAVKDFSGGTPRIQPRNDDKKHLMQKRVMKGHHAFDNYNLPIV